MKKETVFQPFEDGNKDCGPACLEMITHKSVDYFKQKLGIENSRNTKKKELLAELAECGFRVAQQGRISSKTPLESLEEDALLFGRFNDEEGKPGHWAVWDSTIKAVRDPNGYRVPYCVTSFTTLRKK